MCKVNIDPGIHNGWRKRIANWGLEIILALLLAIFASLLGVIATSFSYTHSVEQRMDARLDILDKSCLTREKLEVEVKNINTAICERMDDIERRLQDIKTFMQLLFSRKGAFVEKGGMEK